MSISVVTIAKNIITQGYCFWESLESCVPLMDELIISEGNSSDKTLYYLEKFRDKYRNKFPIILYQEEWPDKSYHGEAITKVSMNAISRSTKDFILYLQLDEIYHENLINYIKNIDLGQYNAVSLLFNHFNRQWRPSNDGYKEAIRMVRRSKNIKLVGDAYTFDKCDPVCYVNPCYGKVFHFNWIFPKCNDIKDIEHAKLYENFPCYKEKMKTALKNLNQPKIPYPIDPNFGIENFPPLARRFIGAVEYTLPNNI